MEEKKKLNVQSYPQYEYVQQEKVQLIEINIKRVGQLFNSFDPSPFLEKDLDDDAFEYIVSSVAEHPLHIKQRIVIYMPKHQKGKISEIEIKKAVTHFFEYKRILAEKNIKLSLQEGQFSFIVGLAFLAACLFVTNWLSTFHQTVGLNILIEGLVIGGWVGMWKPISALLYDWWPLNKEKKIYKKIASMDIEFRYL